MGHMINGLAFVLDLILNLGAIVGDCFDNYQLGKC